VHKDLYVRPEDGCHKPLESGGTIAVALLDDVANEDPEDGNLEACPIDVLRNYSDLLKSLGHVKLQAIGSACDVMLYCVLVRERHNILYGVVVPLSTVHHRSQFTILLWDAKKRNGVAGLFGNPRLGVDIVLHLFVKYLSICVRALRMVGSIFLIGVDKRDHVVCLPKGR
jgi:hypothetical protein